MPAHERIVFDTDEYGRLLVEREPAPELVRFAGTGPDRGAWEEANDNHVEAEYLPPAGAGTA